MKEHTIEEIATSHFSNQQVMFIHLIAGNILLLINILISFFILLEVYK